jgi:hypothetical protein
MATKLTPLKTPKAPKTTVSSVSSEADTQKLILAELQKQTEYFHRMDWKLWMLMNMVRLIGEENGYHYEINEQNPDDPINE